MTSPPTGLPRRSADTALEAVRSVTGGAPAIVTVTAVVVTRGRSQYLEATLAAVRAQSHAPSSIVVVDVETARSTSAHRGLSLNGARYVAAGSARSFGDAVNAALSDFFTPADAKHPDWLWLLHDDAAPAPNALAALIRSIEYSKTVAVAGCKQRRWEHDPDGEPLPPNSSDRDVLLQVGYTVSPLGHRMTGLDGTEIDQGQHDARDDVLAVGLAGALVRTSAWRDLGGTDPEFGQFGDGLEFCRRVRLAGYRVIVVPGAVVQHAQVSLRDPSSAARLRRSRLRFRLIAASPWLLGWVMLGMVLGAPFLAAYRLAVKQPAAARHELAAPLWMLLGLGSVLRARRRTARSATEPYRVLKPLLGTWRQALRDARDRRLARTDTHDPGPDDLDRADLLRLTARRHTVLSLVLVAATAATAAVFGPVLGTLLDGGRFTGGALLASSSTTVETWTAATTDWIRTGLGASGAPDPLLLTLTGLSALGGGSLQTGVNALLVCAIPLAALGGWAASGAVTRSVGVRAVAALTWTAAPGFLAALSGGLIGALVAHLALPWAALALIRSVGGGRIDLPPGNAHDIAGQPHTTVVAGRGRRLGAAGAAGITLAIAVTGAPILLPIAVVVLAAGACVAPARRAYLALALIPSLVATAPLLVFAARTRDAGLLLADPLVAPGVLAGESIAGWQALAGVGQAPGAWFGGVLPGLEFGPYLLGGLVVCIALGSLFGTRAGGARVGWVLAMCGIAVVVPPVTIGDDGTSGAVGASVILLGLGGAALCATRVTAPRRAVRTVAALGIAVPVVVGLVGAAGLTSWYMAGPLTPEGLHVTAEPAVPAVGRQVQAPPRQARVMELGYGSDGAVQYALLRDNGTQLVDASVAGRSTQVPAAVDDAVAALATGTDDDVAGQLAELGIGAIQVTAKDSGNAALIAMLDMTAGVERIVQGQPIALWRVHAAQGPAPSWARIDSHGAVSLVPSQGPGTETAVGPGPTGRTVVLAESADPDWTATLDGRRLAPVDVEISGTTLQGFELEADGGQLVVRRHAPYRPAWLIALGATGLIFTLLALPMPGRKHR